MALAALVNRFKVALYVSACKSNMIFSVITFYYCQECVKIYAHFSEWLENTHPSFKYINMVRHQSRMHCGTILLYPIWIYAIHHRAFLKTLIFIFPLRFTHLFVCFHTYMLGLGMSHSSKGRSFSVLFIWKGRTEREINSQIRVSWVCFVKVRRTAKSKRETVIPSPVVKSFWEWTTEQDCGQKAPSVGGSTFLDERWGCKIFWLPGVMNVSTVHQMMHNLTLVLS